MVEFVRTPLILVFSFVVLHFLLMDFGKTSASELVKLITGGETTARAAVESSFAAAEKLKDSLNAFLEVDRDGALKRAESISGQGALGSSLAGIPLAIKDNICVRGLQTSCASRHGKFS